MILISTDKIDLETFHRGFQTLIQKKKGRVWRSQYVFQGRKIANTWNSSWVVICDPVVRHILVLVNDTLHPQVWWRGPTPPELHRGSAAEWLLVPVSATPLPVFDSTIFSELKEINVTAIEIHDDKEEVTVISFLVNLRKDICINSRFILLWEKICQRAKLTI